MHKPLALLVILFLFVLASIPAYSGDDPLGGNTTLSDTYSHLCAAVTGICGLDGPQDWTLFRLPEIAYCLPRIASSAIDSRAPPVQA